MPLSLPGKVSRRPGGRRPCRAPIDGAGLRLGTLEGVSTIARAGRPNMIRLVLIAAVLAAVAFPQVSVAQLTTEEAMQRLRERRAARAREDASPTASGPTTRPATQPAADARATTRRGVGVQA